LRVNLISSLDENSCLEKIFTPNQVYTWFLYKAFVEDDIDARLINEVDVLKKNLPKTDHTIVVSIAALASMMRTEEYVKRLRDSTTGKLARYMNADKIRGDRYFDLCFTQIPPVPSRSEKHVCVGWGVDPNYSYPEQAERAAFLDSKVLQPRSMKKTRDVYQIYDDVLPELDIKIYNPVSIYNESERLPYLEYQTILRKCHYFLCTQFGEGGLNRLEAAACGALLVVPHRLYRGRTMSLLNNQVWHTKEDLVNILCKDVNIEANRQRALEHNWKNVIRKMTKSLEE